MEQQPRIETSDKKNSAIPAAILVSAIAAGPGMHASETQAAESMGPDGSAHAQAETGVDASYASMAQIILKRWSNVYNTPRSGDEEQNKQAIRASFKTAFQQFIAFADSMGGDKVTAIKAFEWELNKAEMSEETREAIRGVIESVR